METRPLYKKLANLVQARLNCINSGSVERTAKHEERINDLMENFTPNGPGIDSSCTINFNRSHGEYLVFNLFYHTIDEYGYYERWTDFTVTVRPSLRFCFVLTVTGGFGNDWNIKDYLYDKFDMALRSEVE